MKRALMYATVASMIDLFNMDNIAILQNLGYQVDVACNFEEGSVTSQERVKEFANELHDMGVRTYHIPIPRSIYKVHKISKSYELTKKLTKNNYDLVHCHTPIGSIICRAAFKNDNARMIYTAHGFHFYKGAPKKNWLIYYPIEKFFARYTDTLITINQEDYLLAKEKFVSAGEISYINGVGIDLNKFTKGDANRSILFTEYNISDSDFLLVSVGELSIRKNHEIVIRAIKELDDQRIKYVIIGQGELKEYLEALIFELGLENQVYLLGYRKNIKDYLLASNVFVFPSLQEGLPVALMEAMAVGLPAIASDIRGNNDLITHGKGGFLFDFKNVDSLIEALKTLISDQELVEDFSHYNLEKIKLYDSKNVWNQMLKIYRGF